MLYINKGEVNNLVLNINLNSRTQFATYDLVFTHIMSKQQKTYVISTSNPAQYTSNIRYCTIVLDLEDDDLIYEGQYQLNIFGDEENEVYVTMVELQSLTADKPFTEYISPNEVNENYIYIKD
jgi:hypothetical protein